MTKRPAARGLHLLSLLALLLLALPGPADADKLLVFMDKLQNDHLKAYGLTYWTVAQGIGAKWLLNYRGGSFLLDDLAQVRAKANTMGVSFQPISEDQVLDVLRTIEESNMDAVPLEKAPKIAVYTPPDKRPWDDAVTMVLTYAEIPFDKVWDREVLAGRLKDYDWLHLHHEDFSGQYGKFYGAFRNKPWYQNQVKQYQDYAREAGFPTVQAHKCAVAKALRQFVESKGFLFAMCSATDTLDIALAADGIDIVPPEIDGTPQDPAAQAKLDFSKTFAFKDFKLENNAYVYEYSNIDIDPQNYTRNPAVRGDFTLFEFSAKLDRSPTILTQNHENTVKGFLGQTTAFRKSLIKDSVIVLGRINEDEVKYIYGNIGEGAWTWYGGHDPEDFAHDVGEEPTNVAVHKNSPGYRLILNNILFPAVKKKKMKT